jgi:hypothetical protein
MHVQIHYLQGPQVPKRSLHQTHILSGVASVIEDIFIYQVHGILRYPTGQHTSMVKEALEDP